jgi:hypothetical protein
MTWPYFSKIGKGAKDLITKGFDTDNKIKASGKADDVSTKAELSGFGDTVKGKLEFGYNAKAFKVDKIEVGTGNKLFVDLQYELGDTTFDPKFEHSLESPCCTGSLEISHKECPLTGSAVNTKIDFAPRPGPSFDLNFVNGYQNFFIGGSASWNCGLLKCCDKSKSGEGEEKKAAEKKAAYVPTDYALAGGYKFGKQEITLRAEKKLTKFSLGYHHKLSSTFTSWGALLQTTHGKKDSTSLGLATEFQLSDNFKGKAKIEAPTGVVSLSGTHQFAEGIKITLGTSFDAADGSNSSIGTQLEFSF